MAVFFLCPYALLIGLHPRIDRSILRWALWYSDVTKGHCQIRLEHLPVTGAHVISSRCYCQCWRSGGLLRRVCFELAGTFLSTCAR